MAIEPVPGAIIFLNGASSSGKSTLAQGLQLALETPFWHYSIDHLRAAKVLPWARIESGEFPWPSHREAFFDGFHRSIPAFAAAGNHLIVEHIIETDEWLFRLAKLLDGFDVFLVGVNCPLDVLEQRERERGDRTLGQARRDFETALPHLINDLEVDGLAPTAESASAVLACWRKRGRPSAMESILSAGVQATE